tara:strand:+ start:1002 stop:1607 length:606 start_codon:yes stop_codon:yes gene_type:complete
MALFRPYCTVADVQKYIRNSSLATDDYETAINMASRHVEKICGTDFWTHTYADSSPYRLRDDEITHEGLYLRWPIVSLSQVTVGDDVQESTSYSFQSDAGLYNKSNFIRNVDMILFDNDAFPEKVEVSGTFGYTTSDEESIPTDDYFPAGVRRAATIIAGAFTNRNQKDEIGLDGTRQSLLDTEVPAEAKKLLRPYGRFVM